MNYNSVISERQDRGEVITPEPLVEKMLDKLPQEVFESETTTFLDPCFGTGSFLKAIVLRLKSYGHSTENINSRVFGFEISSKMFYETKRKFSGINIVKQDFLNTNINMKFDVIVGNPPYQHPTNKRWKLWVSFIEKASECVSNGGSISMVTPIAWLNSKGKELEHAKSILTNMNLINVKTDVNNYFKVGENIGYFHVINSKPSSNVIIDDVVMDINNLPKTKVQLITEKVTSSFVQNIYEDSKSVLTSKKNDLNSGVCSPIKDDVYTIKVQHTGSCVLYYKNNDKFNNYMGHNVIINMSGYYYKPGKNYIYYEKDAIAGRGCQQLTFQTEQDCYNAINILTCKLFRFIVDFNKTSGFNFQSFSYLPKITDDLMSLQNDQQIYQYFNLTQEEIDYIENAVK